MRLSMYFKMFNKTWLIFLVVNLVLDYTYGQRDKKFFRKDYTYIDALETFYKIHTLRKTWTDAKRMCALEGASLFYAENDDEAQAVTAFWNNTQPFYWIYVGISDLVAKGVFETIEGIPVSDVYNNWGPGEPNDSNGIEDCVVMGKNSIMNDEMCSKKFPYICKKSIQSLEWNTQCNMPHLGYTFKQELGRCYKFHKKPLNWPQAYAACSAEQSYLTIINTQLEADHLVRMIEAAPIAQVTETQVTVHSGFHNRGNDGWQTVRGTALEDSGYVKWGNNQPDGGDREQCGAMSYDGHLNDISCDTRSFFICEHEVNTLSSDFDDRFGNTVVH